MTTPAQITATAAAGLRRALARASGKPPGEGRSKPSLLRLNPILCAALIPNLLTSLVFLQLAAAGGFRGKVGKPRQTGWNRHKFRKNRHRRDIPR